MAKVFLISLVLAAGLVSSCRGNKPASIDWDLSRSHTLADVDFPRPDLTANEIAPIDSVKIRLPGGKVFTGGDELHNVSLTRDRDVVTELQIDTKPLTTDEAYRVALRRADEWGLPRGPIEEWHRERLAQRERGKEDIDSTALSTVSGLTVGEGGPNPSLKILSSFVDDRPSIVSVRFFWA